MIGSYALLEDPKRARVDGERFVRLAGLSQRLGQVPESLGDIRMIGAERSLLEGDRFLVCRNGRFMMTFEREHCALVSKQPRAQDLVAAEPAQRRIGNL